MSHIKESRGGASGLLLQSATMWQPTEGDTRLAMRQCGDIFPVDHHASLLQRHNGKLFAAVLDSGACLFLSWECLFYPQSWQLTASCCRSVLCSHGGVAWGNCVRGTAAAAQRGGIRPHQVQAAAPLWRFHVTYVTPLFLMSFCFLFKVFEEEVTR